MTRIYVGPSTLYDLGQVGELSLLDSFDGEVVIPEAVADAVDVEPAATNLEAYLSSSDVDTATDEEYTEQARSLLGRPVGTSVAVIAGVLAHRDPEDRTAVAVLSQDRTVRRLAQGLGAEVSSSFGVVVRATLEDKYLKPSQAKRIIRRIDQHGLHMTGELRERAVGEVAE